MSFDIWNRGAHATPSRGLRHRGPALALVLLAGCYPVTRLQTPRTTPAGKVNGALAGALSGRADERNGDISATLDAALSVGITDRVDVRLRLRPVGLELGPKIQLARSALEVSVAPALIVAEDSKDLPDTDAPFASVSVLASRTSLYVGSNLDHSFAFFLAPTLDLGRRSFVGGSHALLFAPGALGGAVLSPHPNVHFLLELGALFPAAGQQGRLGPGDQRFEISAGLLFGSFSERD
jgi:hypothetical protein